MSHKTNFFKAGILALLAIFGLAACAAAHDGGPGWRPGTGTYTGHGVSFHYPAGWYQTTPLGGGRPLLWTIGVGFDPPDSVYIAAHPTGTRVTAQNIPVFIPSVTRAVRMGFRHAGDRLLAGSQAITVGGMPGLRFQGTETNPVGKDTLTIVFNGMTWYDITCAYTPAKARAVQRGCAQVLRTFKVSR
jgi:hypothetical protein